MEKKKFIFFVQGEGRGHLTQAIALKEILIRNGHTIAAIVIGMSQRREIPEYVKEKFNCPIVRLESPNFVTDKKNKGIKITASIINALLNLGRFRKSLQQMHQLLELHQPEALINFFDPLVGLYYLTTKCKIPHISIAHQYIYHHEKFRFPRSKFTDRFALKWFTGLTSVRASRKLAISFYQLSPSRDTTVSIVPPLLREDLFSLQPNRKGYVLVYLVNNGYLENILNWHQQNPDVEIHCFTDKKALPTSLDAGKNMHLHQLNDKLFLEKMSEATALISTAGFESVCEAMYLDKPVLMVPVEGHFEQYCNSRDAFLAGAGIYSSAFDIRHILEYSHEVKHTNHRFRNWVDSSPSLIYNQIITAIA
jgi:uncharacterized protein (TIGR00661 family)